MAAATANARLTDYSPFDDIPPLGFVHGNISAAIFQGCRRNLKFFINQIIHGEPPVLLT